MRLTGISKFLLLTLFATASACPVQAETRTALVIGNAAYGSRALSSPNYDATTIAFKLESLGFQVTRKADLRRQDFLIAIRDFGERLHQPDTVALFYYSGHGMQVNNRNYMIPIDADINSEADVENFAVPVDNILVRIGAGKSNPNFVILDACRDNPFEKRYKGWSDGFAPMAAPSSTLIAFAAAPGRVAEDGSDGKLSLYTAALAQHIDQPYPNFVFMFQAVHNAVFQQSRGKQSPRLELSPGLLDFTFRSVSLPSSQPAAETPDYISLDPPVSPELKILWPCDPITVFLESSERRVSNDAVVVNKYEMASAKFAQCGRKFMIIEGHTDRSGDALQNLHLSLERAFAAKAYFNSKFGIPENVIVAVGYGESRPLVATADGVSEPQNRRVEIRFADEQDARLMKEESELERTFRTRLHELILK